YRSLRVPARFLYPATVALTLVAVSALIAARRAAEERAVLPWLRHAFVGVELCLALFVAADLCVVGTRTIQMGVDPPLPRVRAAAGFYQDSGSDYSRLATNPTRGIGTRACYVAIEWQTAPGIADGPVPQVRVEPPDAGHVVPTGWSPNAVLFSANLTRA